MELTHTAPNASGECRGPEDLLRDQPCSDCAFTPGTAANLYKWTASKAEFCVMASEPFWCHMGPQGADRKLCMGWAARVAFGPEQPQWRKDVAKRMLDFLDGVEDKSIPHEEQLAALYRAAMGTAPAGQGQGGGE